jgi:hypothetical protein
MSLTSRLSRLRAAAVGPTAIAVALASCGGGGSGTTDASRDGAAADAGGTRDTAGADAPPATQSFALNVTAVDTTFATEDHFIAAVEMQISGEPFAEAMGRELGGYSRNYVCQGSVCQASLYFDPSLPPTDAGAPAAAVDLPGYASGVESYEYSKQPMNNIAFESGAGTSLLFGPVLNPDGLTGTDALQLAQDWMIHMGAASNGTSRFVHAITDTNPLGWPGLWPTLQPFASWNPAITRTNESGCSLSSDDNAGAQRALLSDNYECDYTTLHLPDRAAQVSMTIGPGSSGWDALAHSPQSPLRWFPSSIGVTETSDAGGFPRPAGCTIVSSDSHLLDLAGLVGAYASVYALTDQANAAVGGSQPALAPATPPSPDDLNALVEYLRRL